MKTSSSAWGLAIRAIALAGMFASAASAQTRSAWQMHDGLEVTPDNPNGLVAFTCAPAVNGDVCEYDVAIIPALDDPGWGPAPDPEVIAFSVFPSRVCGAPVECLAFGDFTYFQTVVDVPANVAVTTFTISFSGMDDGSRVSIFNSVVPDGLVIPGSFVFVGGTGTTDLSPFVVSGERNRVIITQVDDCCNENTLDEARVVLNGEVIHTGCDADSDCDDVDACSTDRCDPALGCLHEAVACNDANACTEDACDPALGCVFSAISCDDGDPDTTDWCHSTLGCKHVTSCSDDDGGAHDHARHDPSRRSRSGQHGRSSQRGRH